METFTMTYLLFCVVFVALIMPMAANPTPVTEDSKDDEGLLSPSEEIELVPVGVMAEEKDNDEIMDTANARYYSDYYFRPVYTYRRVHSNRRRVYVPRRHSSYDSEDRFPTVA